MVYVIISFNITTNNLTLIKSEFRPHLPLEILGTYKVVDLPSLAGTSSSAGISSSAILSVIRMDVDIAVGLTVLYRVTKPKLVLLVFFVVVDLVVDVRCPITDDCSIKDVVLVNLVNDSVDFDVVRPVFVVLSGTDEDFIPEELYVSFGAVEVSSAVDFGVVEVILTVNFGAVELRLTVISPVLSLGGALVTMLSDVVIPA